jgi:hypothetical protein
LNRVFHCKLTKTDRKLYFLAKNPSDGFRDCPDVKNMAVIYFGPRLDTIPRILKTNIKKFTKILELFTLLI